MIEFIIRSLVIGVGATVVFDLWGLFLNKALGLPLSNWAMVGRWFGHMPRGTFAHAGIGQSPAIASELTIGWIAHYAIGVIFAAALLAIWGTGWAKAPTLLPALIVGWVTILCGWLILSPGMGNGIAAARSPNPLRSRLMNLAGHTVFGFGLWGTALMTRGWM
jgi:hypothetical protein